MRRAWRRWHPFIQPQWWIVLGGAVVPLTVAVLSAWSHGWTSTGDFAHTELATRDVPGHLPLIGVAGRFGSFDNQHSHPGPAMAYAFAPIYRLLGSSSEALLASAAAIHVIGLCIAVWAAGRIGGRSFAVCAALAGAVLTRAIGVETLITPWNPRMPLLVFFAFVLVSIGIVNGKHRWLPLGVALATYCAQTHISYLVLVTGTFGAAALWCVVDLRIRRRADASQRAGVLRSLLTAVAVGGVLWLPVAWDQLRRTRNFSWLVGRFTHSCDARWWGSECAQAVGLRSGSRALAAEGNPFGGWVTGTVSNPQTGNVNVVGLVIAVTAVAFAVGCAWRRRDRRALSALGTVLTVSVLAVFSAARVLGDFYEYVIRWSWSLAAAGAATVMWAVWPDIRGVLDRRGLRLQTPRDGRFGTGLVGPLGGARLAVCFALLVGSVVAIAAAVPAFTAQGPYDADSRSTAALSARAAAVLDPERSYLLRWHDPAGLGGIGFGMINALEDEGFDVGADSWTRYAVGQHRVTDPSRVDAILFVVVGDASIAQFKATKMPDSVATFDPRSPQDKVESEAARATIERRLGELGRTDLLERIDGQFGNAALIAASSELPPDVNEAVSTYTDLRLPVALFLLAPEAADFS